MSENLNLKVVEILFTVFTAKITKSKQYLTEKPLAMKYRGKCIADIFEPTLFARQKNLKSYNFKNGLS